MGRPSSGNLGLCPSGHTPGAVRQESGDSGGYMSAIRLTEVRCTSYDIGGAARRESRVLRMKPLFAPEKPRIQPRKTGPPAPEPATTHHN